MWGSDSSCLQVKHGYLGENKLLTYNEHMTLLYTALKGTYSSSDEGVQNKQCYCRSICNATLFSRFLSVSTDLKGDTREMKNSGI